MIHVQQLTPELSLVVLVQAIVHGSQASLPLSDTVKRQPKVNNSKFAYSVYSSPLINPCIRFVYVAPFE